MNEQGKQLVEFLLHVPYFELSENLQKEIELFTGKPHAMAHCYIRILFG